MRIGKPPLKPREPRSKLRREEAETLAVQALVYIAADEGRLERFLAVTGVDPGSLRSEAGRPGFLAGVLDYVCTDEALLVGFAADQGKPPEAITGAQQMLSGPRGEDW
jgi:hypothetical protein